MRKAINTILFYSKNDFEFEHLVFAYVSQHQKWNTIEWIGKQGIDKVRNIWSTNADTNETYCFQCINHSRLTFYKAIDVIDKLSEYEKFPHHLIIVCGGAVSLNLKNRITNYALSLGVKTVAIWTAMELEQSLRTNAPDLLKKFVEGNLFPDPV